jgi:hypothetical protein
MTDPDIFHRVRRQLWRFRDALYERLGGKTYREGVFRRILAQNLWGDAESLSGYGSGWAATRAVREELPRLFQRHGINSMLDAPCGDFYWMREVVGVLDRYVGADIVPDLIDRNRERYGSDRVSFICADITVDPLPRADLILCRDGMIHLPTRLIRRALANLRATGSRYLLLTNSHGVSGYHDVPIGSFRPIDFTQPPFSFPTPLDVLLEDDSGERQLALWDFDTLSTR